MRATFFSELAMVFPKWRYFVESVVASSPLHRSSPNGVRKKEPDIYDHNNCPEHPALSINSYK